MEGRRPDIDAVLPGTVDGVLAGSGRVLVVVGRRGSGRTRWALGAERRAGMAGLRVLAARTGGVSARVPFEVIAGPMAELAGLPADHPHFAGVAAPAWPLVSGQALPQGPVARDRMTLAVHWLVRRLSLE